MKKETTVSFFHIITSLFVLGLATFLAIHETFPNKVLPGNTPAFEFSAERAMWHIEVIAAEPRPAGTESNIRAREYIVKQLTQLGLEPVIQSATVCGHFPKAWCANPNNILTKIDGTDSTDAILLVAHYDSQQFCPCASDDAHGVAVLLETARAILAGEPLKNTVILLFSDAHEWNFQGAAAFVTQHPWAEQVRLVFSYDAAYSGGPASMLVYDPQSAWIIDELPHIGEYPFTNSSLRYFQDHPGGDLNAFLANGYSGFEAGFWANAYYHSSLDNIENFKPASLHQQGSAALAMVRHFGNLELVEKQEPCPVYFNLLRQWLVVYPASWVLPITTLVIMSFVGILIFGLKRRRLTWSGMGLAALVFLISLVMSGLVVVLLFGIIPLINPLYETGHTANLEGMVYNQPWLAAAFAGLAIALTITCYNLLLRFRKISLVEVTMGTLAILLVGLFVVSLVAPGASYLLAWPLLFSLLAPAYWLLAKNGTDRPLSTLPLLGLLVAGAVTILIQVPMIMAAYLATSPTQAFIPTMSLVVMTGFLMAHLHILTERRRWWLPALAGILTLGILIPVLLDNFDAKKPQYFDLFYLLDADHEKAVWGMSNAPEEDVQALLFPQGVEVRTFPWLIINSQFHIADAPQTSLLAPAVALIEDMVAGDIRTMHLRFSSQREATILYAKVTNPDLIFHSVTVNGITSVVPLNQNQLDVDKLILPEGISLSDEFQNRTLFYFEGLGAGEWVNVIIEVGAGESVDLIVLDSSFGLPSFSEALLDLLPPGSQPGHEETTVYTAVSFGNGK